MSKKNKFIHSSFVQKILQTIEDHGMIRKGDAVLVGVSGGPDSMALFHAMAALSGDLDIRLGVAHLNHCLRGRESDKDEEFVAAVAQRLGMPFYSERMDIRKEREKTRVSLEEAARAVRYCFFHKIRRDMGFDKIALGHHQDDNAELILLYLLRGSGPAGISGIPPIRGDIIRPLIRVYRSEILEFLKILNIAHVLDSSNDDPQFLRNRIRHQLLPVLKTGYNPKIVQSLNRLGNILRSEEAWLTSIIAPLYDAACVRTDEDRTVLSVSRLRDLHPAALSRVIRKAIGQVKGDLRRISWKHIESIVEFIQRTGSDAHTDIRLDLPDRIRIIRNADHLIIARENQNLRPSKPATSLSPPVIFEYQIPLSTVDSGTPAVLSEINARIQLTRIPRDQIRDLSGCNSRTAFFDWDRLQFPLTIRNMRPGDRFVPLGAGGTQKLKKFFIDHKIPISARPRVPVVVSNEVIIWIGGHRISEQVKITPETRTILKTEILNSDK